MIFVLTYYLASVTIIDEFVIFSLLAVFVFVNENSTDEG